MGKKRNFAFIVELFILFVILLFVIIVLTKTFVTSRSQSLYARHLTESVYLAEEVAEVSMSAADAREAQALLGALEQTEEIRAKDRQMELTMDFTADDTKRDTYRVLLSWEEEASAQGTFVAEEILVFFADETDPLYTLHTGNYQSEDAQ